MTATPTEQAVTQADKDAANEWVRQMPIGLKLTLHEPHKLYQAFARHRLRATPPTTPARERHDPDEDGFGCEYDDDGSYTLCWPDGWWLVAFPSQEIVVGKSSADPGVKATKMPLASLALATEATGRSEADVRGEALEEAARVALKHGGLSRLAQGHEDAEGQADRWYDGNQSAAKEIATAIRALIAQPASGGGA